MGFWRDAAFTAAVYGIRELVDRKKEKSAPTKTLEDINDPSFNISRILIDYNKD
ncbi:MAG: hypothetical protein II670_14765 [Alphaproteobacteria bacterium]|nr:hypothetical protein [Alphaproteobacteria bacterium]